jgi:hypothetical protein
VKESCKSYKNDKLDKCIVPNQFTYVHSPSVAAAKDHLERVSGRRPEFRPLQPTSLPLFLRERFSFYTTEIFDQPWCLALENESWDVGSPLEYEKQLEGLRPHFQAPLAFVFSSLSSSTRNRLVQKGIPFIVPGTQIFLPPALLDLRERYPRLGGQGRAVLTPTAQLAVIYHLQREPLEGISLREIAGKLHCSAMMASKVRGELVDAGICTVQHVGRSVTLHFPENRQVFWDSVKERLVSPVKKSRWVRWHGQPGYPALLAGVSALSRSTLLADDPLPTFALGPRILDAWVQQGIMSGCPDSEQANARIEVWSYEPKILGGNETVDPFSLYLSLRTNPDERVQQALRQLMEQVPW